MLGWIGDIQGWQIQPSIPAPLLLKAYTNARPALEMVFGLPQEFCPFDGFFSIGIWCYTLSLRQVALARLVQVGFNLSGKAIARTKVFVLGSSSQSRASWR